MGPIGDPAIKAVVESMSKNEDEKGAPLLLPPKQYKCCTEYTEPKSSIEVNKTTKGYTWKIKLYFTKEDKHIDKISELDRELRKRFKK